MSRLFSMIIVLAILVSCRKNMEPAEPYFKFDAVGEQLLSGLKLNDTLKFRGSNGFHQEYKVFKIEKIKQTVQDCSWNFGTCKTYYHYDALMIYFLRTDSMPPPPNSPPTYWLTIQMQLPAGVDKEHLPKNLQVKAVVHGNAFINYNKIPAPANTSTSPFISYPDFYSSLQTTTFSNSVKTYNEVVIINSGNNAVYVESFYTWKYTVNEVWFDKKYGFVFFKDVFGNSWSRTN